MSEDSFFDALFHIMWKMEVDIFSEKNKTLALLADLVPKCRKQRRRIAAMYSCGAMDLIEQAVADEDNYELNLKRAVRKLVEDMEISDERAMFAVNEIIELWDGDLNKLKSYDKDENLGEVCDKLDEGDADSIIDDAEEGEDMLFLQDVAADDSEEQQEENEPQEEQNTEQSDSGGDNGSDDGNDGGDGGDSNESEAPPKSELIKKLIHFWCEGDYEEGRPYMFACPIGWILIFLCCILGAFMVYDVLVGDKLVVPVFAFMFAVLASKRLYRFESSGRFSILIALFYIAAMARVMWSGSDNVELTCVPIVLASLVVFNSGRVGSWLDESKMKPAAAYSVITVLSAILAVGVYAVQHVSA